MKVLHVIHGYPMRYNAGSEVYTQMLCQGLASKHEVHVFTRQENLIAPDFQMRVERDPDDMRIELHIVNNPRNRDRYREPGIDRRFAEVLDRVQPEIVHVGHLNHLSSALPREAAARSIPVLYTLHDYWPMCPRGQFMQTSPRNPKNLWAACDGQQDRKCAERCYASYFGGAREESETDIGYWSDWVGRRMRHVREMSEFVDLFVAPSRYLHDRYRDEFGLPEAKLAHLDYGFDLTRLRGRQRVRGEPFTFGYIGTHIPAKGIHDLIQAFGNVQGESVLRIWGRPQGQHTEALKVLAQNLPDGKSKQVSWHSEYRNQDIVREVFNRVDAIVVPSVWVENSPLVIHEAQQVRVPVIAADVGGMAEYVRHEVNGLQFKHRSYQSLAAQMQRFVNAPDLARRLGQRGYVFSKSGDIPDIENHVREIENLYQRVLERRGSARVKTRKGPWRITFDTNPDTCNLRCIMCEEHSPHSPLQVARRKAGRPRRLMPIELICKVVADAAAAGELREIIPSTMGEPLLYENFEDILKLCSQYDVRLNLTTNGTFPRLGAKAWAERIVPVASDVKISWNGAGKATQEAIMLGSKWDKVLGNVQTFIAIRDDQASSGGNWCRVTFQLTFLEANVAELADIVRLAIKLGVDRVKGHHLWAHFKEIKQQSMRRSRDAVHRWNQAVFQAREAATERRLPNGQHILLENIFPLKEESDGLALGGPCPFLGQEAWVSAQGRFDPCCAPDALRRTLGDFGNLHEQGIMDIWNGRQYRNLIATYRSRNLCLGCNMRKPLVEGQ